VVIGVIGDWQKGSLLRPYCQVMIKFTRGEFATLATEPFPVAERLARLEVAAGNHAI
jgi:hypothetical protein